MMKFCFVFVCQAGELEIKSLLLAASLRQYVQGDYELVAALPQPVARWGTLSTTTTALLQQLDIRTVPITNNIDENYPIANKIACLGIATPAEKIIFLDSDILCLQPIILNNYFSADFNAKPADLATFGKNPQLWQKVYQLFQLPLPAWQTLSTVSRELMLPYFNAGVIAIKNNPKFANTWEECCRIIDADTSISHKRPWLDQIALPVVITRLNLTHYCLDERFNYPAHLKPLSKNTFFCHYHYPVVIRREPVLNKLVNQLVDRYPALKTLLETDAQWATLLRPPVLQKLPRKWFIRPLISAKKPMSDAPGAIITGMPRSGTSYLCRLLHSLQNCVVINEPTAIFKPLENDAIPWQLAIFYQDLRRHILEGYPIENKIKDGQLIEDTAIIDERNLYYPQVSHRHFMLCTKNTLAYMARIPQLRQVLPHMPIIACFRNPFDTIASWKSTFSHLQQADVAHFPIGHVADPFLTSWQRQRLQQIAMTPKLALKRALLWAYLAEILLIYQNDIILLPYETLVTQPTQILREILNKVPNIPTLYPTEKITASVVRQKRNLLTTEDIEAIHDVCGQLMIELESATNHR